LDASALFRCGTASANRRALISFWAAAIEINSAR
jgi:hypothetical protein